MPPHPLRPPRPLPDPLPPYAELHCLSNFSFLRGASHPGELVAEAARLGYAALALTDECSLAGVVRAHTAAIGHGLRLIVGSEFRLADGPRLVLLAMDRAGYGRLSTLVTRGRRAAPKGRYRLVRQDLDAGLEGCLALLLPPYPAADTPELEADARWLGARFPGRAWIAVELHRLGRDRAHLAALEALGRRSGLPLTAAGDVHMHRRGRRPLQDALTAIRLGTTVERAGLALFANAERHLRSRARLARIYPPALLAESVAIAERCTFSLDELRYEYPTDGVPPGESPQGYLRRLTLEGMARRWPGGTPMRIRRMIARELAIIAGLGYAPYFLTVHDIVRFARSRGILCQGRGSAANSAVCYCLGITAVDPERIDMLFERFVSRERNEPPDIDVDFEHERREEVMQYVYERYGRDRAALTATVICYRRRSALRDLGKALGLSLEQVDRLAGNVASWDTTGDAAGTLDPERVREAGLDPESPVLRRLTALAAALEGFPRHLSQHVGGFVIGRGPIHELVPVENAAMTGRTVIQWDKDDLDTMGLLKVDCLALGMLTAIRRCLDLIARHQGRRLELATIPAEDPEVYAMIQRADTVGVFQIESRAQMSMLPRLRPACFYDLVIEVAIVRPGPIQGQMVHPYLRRRQGLEPVRYPGPEVRAVLERTLGVPIFQEQVIKLAMVAAGFSAGEADGLRRAIGSWRRREQLAHYRARLIEGMLARGYERGFAEQIYRQIQGFGEYGFPESHAASFALLVYVSAWLKRHHPAAFACALLNSQPMGFYAPAQLVQDARRHGVEVRPVDVCRSHWDCSLEPRSLEPRRGREPALRLGLRMVRGLGRAEAESLVAERGRAPFRDFDDLARRCPLSRRARQALADAGALATLAGHRRLARWRVLGIEPPSELLGAPAQEPELPLLPRPRVAEEVVADYASLGLSLGPHPLALLRPRLEALALLPAARLRTLRDGAPVRVCGLVVTRQHPVSAGGVIFLTLEDESGHANVIVWEAVSRRFRRALLQARLLEVRGTLQKEGEVIHVVAGMLQDRSELLQGLRAPSRDFR